MSGTVVEFDAEVGLGVIDVGGDRYPFHCVEISDGSRNVAVGADVSFDVLAKFGRYEASNISS